MQTNLLMSVSIWAKQEQAKIKPLGNEKSWRDKQQERRGLEQQVKELEKPNHIVQPTIW